jgi:hypothetical protein
MANNKKPKLSKKKLRKEIQATLQSTFSNLKDSIGEKKFERHVKKASKILCAGATKSIEKIAKSKKAA